MVEPRSTTSRSDPGPAPNDQARRRASASTRSSWRMWPKVKVRRKVPKVEGAITRCGSTDWVAPDLSTSAWSMWLPPPPMAWDHRLGRPRSQQFGMVDVAPARRRGVDQGQHLASGKGTTNTTRQVDHLIDQSFETEPNPQGGHQQQPGIGHQVGVIDH